MHGAAAGAISAVGLSAWLVSCVDRADDESPFTGDVNDGGASGAAPIECSFERDCILTNAGDGTEVTVEPSEAATAELDALGDTLAEVSELDATGLQDRYPTTFTADLGYVPEEALGMDLLQSTSIALTENELARFNELGFVISDRTSFPNFTYGYEIYYGLDLPLFVSADSVLFAIHQSYDSLLRDIETTYLIPALTQVLETARERFAVASEMGFSEEALQDADVYLAVALSLLTGEQAAPQTAASSDDVACLLQGVETLDGCLKGTFMGSERVFDFSQFTIRSHYTETAELGRYFQAMMWLGRIDLRLLETVGSKRYFRRHHLETALALWALLDTPETIRQWRLIDTVVTAFLGEHDSMTLPELGMLMDDLGATSLADLGELDDEAIAQAIVDGGYGQQRISSHIVEGGYTETVPLAAAFLLFGQRYLLDSHVFSNVVYDRVPQKPGYPLRMMPDPLDAAFAALDNNQAAILLEPELSQYGYAPELAEMRELGDTHPPEFWSANLYNDVLSALRTLSPNEETSDPAAAGLPTVAGTGAWGRRLLNTQLASWAEMRHDTLLYAKQSYTAAVTICEYPDAYVDPYPEFWRELVAFAAHGREVTAELGPSSVSTYFDDLHASLTILLEMAENQRAGIPHTAEHLEFINRAIRIQPAGGGCGGDGAYGVDAEGWYADLFYESVDRVAYDPTIADVHTQPTDDNGGIVGRILHVGTGTPRQLVVAVNTCEGPRAYVGLVSSYFERVTDNFERLTDEEWADALYLANPADVPWMSNLVMR